MRNLSLLVPLILLFGCTVYWHKDGASQAQYDADAAECVREADKRLEGYPRAAYTNNMHLSAWNSCMTAKGWERVNDPQSATAVQPL